MRRLMMLAPIYVALLLAPACGGSSTSITGSPPAGKIAFLSCPEGEKVCAAYTVHADGSSLNRLTEENVYSGSPLAWSPDGNRIAFVSVRDGNQEIYVMYHDGSGQTNLTHNAADDFDPAWSPNGNRVAFVSVRDGNPEIYVVSHDGPAQTNLTRNPANDFNPSWSPDDSHIAFNSNRDGGADEIYVMNADGSNAVKVTSDPANHSHPAWSPDGTRIAFVSRRDDNQEIDVMYADGSGLTRLLTAVIGETLAWSPDGSHIALFASASTAEGDPTRNWDIFVLNADGSGLANLTNSPDRNDNDPVWSPDGTYIAFQSADRHGNNDLYVINADGSGQADISKNTDNDIRPAWSPAP